jgi:hypothetical protein
MRICPFSVNLTALLSRLTSTCFTRSGSVCTFRGIGPSSSTLNSRLFCAARGRVRGMTSETICGRSQLRFSIDIRAASILEMSRMSLMIASRCSPLRRMVLTHFSRSGWGCWGSMSISL